MKKYIMVLLVLALLVGLTGCDAVTSMVTGQTSGSSQKADGITTVDAAADHKEDTVIGVNPEFKKAMDSYEDFFDRYVDFMQKLNASPNNIGLLTEYTDYLTQYEETMEKLDAIDETKLSTADDMYYVEVMARIQKKLLSVTQH